ncbi:MAG TPA: ATP-binding protein [Actinomycetota bacterium]|nr:ATP-binding protein [Actinomycetota bacterium]
MATSVRAYRPGDLRLVLGLCESHDTVAHTRSVGVQQAIELLGSSETIALVAETERRLLGIAVGVTAATVGTVFFLATSSGNDNVGSVLLDHLEAHLAEAGAHTLAAVVPDAPEEASLFTERGYRASETNAWVSRDVPATVASPAALAELGARMIDPRLWANLKGMEDAKEIIERRVILPLAQPELAARHAVSTPRAIVLFGPPGTGKTTFAKGIASRLAWPFIEIQPSELAGGGTERQAKELAQAFDRILGLPAAVMFVDEVEDIASIRHEDRRTSPSVTNEFLKQIPRMQEAAHHLLVCATNWVGRLDPAFLRPGRFDHILPVGPPDEEARRAIWQRYVDEITDEKIDIFALVSATEMFTPADIEFAARKAAQQAFEREHFEGIVRRADTEEFLEAIAETKPTLTREMIDAFADDTLRFGRI